MEQDAICKRHLHVQRIDVLLSALPYFRNPSPQAQTLSHLQLVAFKQPLAYRTTHLACSSTGQTQTLSQ